MRNNLYCHPELDSGSSRLNNHSGEIPNQVWNDIYFGFTLIELLVVVLIMGILAAVAVPQYQKAVEKSKTAEVIFLLKSLGQAQKVYQLANGVTATSFDELDVEIPSSYSGNERCNSGANEARSNKDWTIELINSGVQIEACRISGKYAGGAFWYNVADGRILCVERGSGSGNITLAEAGIFCEKLMNKPLTGTHPNGKLRYYAAF